MADIENYKCFSNSKYEILTDEGFKDFNGVICGKNKNKVYLKFKFKNHIIGDLLCTEKHKLCDLNKDVVYAKDIKVGDILYNNIKIIETSIIENDDFVYELLEVNDNHRYYVNGVLSKQCLLLDELAFVPENIVNEFFNAVYPTIAASATAKLLIASTPNGTGNLFHKLWEEAEIGSNDFGNHKITYKDVPGRDEEWARKEIATMGLDNFRQEYGCEFLEAGESFISEQLYNEVVTGCRKPIITLHDDHYKVFEKPNVQENVYIAGVDVGEGVGKCASVCQILDITDLTDIKQVAQWYSRDVGVYEFGSKLFEIMKHWGNPPLAIERNNCGTSVVSQMHNELHYPNLVSATMKQGQYDWSHLKGMTSSTNTKHHAVLNMFYFFKEKEVIELRDVETLKELKTFIRHKNNKWAKKKGDAFFDDRVDAFLWALMILHPSIVQQYFSVSLWDGNKKPLQVIPLYESYSHDNSFLFDNSEENNWGLTKGVTPSPAMDNYNNSDISELNSQGWYLPDQMSDYGGESWSHRPV